MNVNTFEKPTICMLELIKSFYATLEVFKALHSFSPKRFETFAAYLKKFKSSQKMYFFSRLFLFSISFPWFKFASQAPRRLSVCFFRYLNVS